MTAAAMARLCGSAGLESRSCLPARGVDVVRRRSVAGRGNALRAFIAPPQHGGCSFSPLTLGPQQHPVSAITGGQRARASRTCVRVARGVRGGSSSGDSSMDARDTTTLERVTGVLAALRPLFTYGLTFIAGMLAARLVWESLPSPRAVVAVIREVSPGMARTAKAIFAVPTSAWASYLSSLEAAPFTTKIATSLVGCFLGDLLAQVSTHSSAKRAAPPGSPPRFVYNAPHTSRMLVYTLMTAPLLIAWYVLLDAWVMPDNPTSTMAVALKVMADQLGLAPFTTLLYFSCLKAMEDVWDGSFPARLSLRQVWSRAAHSAKSNWLPTMLASYMLWPLAHTINFALVPSSLRILYINVVCVGWSALLSTRAAASSAAAKAEGLPSRAAAGITVCHDIVHDPMTIRSVAQSLDIHLTAPESMDEDSDVELDGGSDAGHDEGAGWEGQLHVAGGSRPA
ncbi:hypothetical protein FOA52_001920 [Chlamydomonas sp. UWO 241]|nr:hypothetical protein FOA52_001920 [Chlamydomonas sp. UWO 241]